MIQSGRKGVELMCRRLVRARMAFISYVIVRWATGAGYGTVPSDEVRSHRKNEWYCRRCKGTDVLQ